MNFQEVKKGYRLGSQTDLSGRYKINVKDPLDQVKGFLQTMREINDISISESKVKEINLTFNIQPILPDNAD